MDRALKTVTRPDAKSIGYAYDNAGRQHHDPCWRRDQLQVQPPLE